MVSAISICFLALGLSAASSQLLSSDADYPDAPISERRTFKHGKPVKFLPLIKKHKKFGGFVPHVFGKTQYAEIPVAPKPFYKVHRYQGIEVKPVSDVSYSTPEPIIESHSVEPPSDFISDHSYSSSPVFSSPPVSFYAPPKQVFSFVPAPQPVFSSIPITIPSSPAFSFSVARPAVIPQPVFAPISSNLPSPPPPPPQPIFSPVPIKIQTPVLPAPSPAPIFPAPSPAPVFPPVPIKIQPPVLPALPAPSPAPVVVKIPAPSPVISVPSPAPIIPVPSPAPVFPSVSPTPVPTFSSFPTVLPPTYSFPSPAPSVQSFPAFQSISAAPEPEYPYPPSGTPIPSYIKDISLGDIDIKGSPVPTIETPEVEDTTKTIEHNFGGIKTDGFFQKIKGWKADKANAALNHFAQFKQKPFIHSSFSLPTVHKLPDLPPSDLPIHPTLQFSSPVHPLPLAPAPVFFPPAQFNPSVKYENFPPNNLETPPLFNSYGVPIPHDSYSPPSHDRLSSAASEEEPAVVPPPSEKKEQNVETKPQPPQQEYQPHNYQFQPQAIPHEHPVYVPEDLKTIKEDNKTIENQQPEIDQNQQDSAYPNHKE